MVSPNVQAVAVIGAGAWGTALAQLLADKGVPVHLWVREPEVCAALSRERLNHTFLPGVKLSSRIIFTQEFAVALQGVRLVLLAVPSHVFREMLRELRPHLPPEAALLSATKGMEIESLLTMEGVVREELGAAFPYAVLSGPSFAREVAHKIPTAVTIASRHREVAHNLQRLFSTPYFRVYTTLEVTGVELGGALKNIFAIGTGILEGMALGANSRAAVITRGLAEMTRLGARLGANPMTLMGLAGLGDLVLTCTSSQSRNFQVGVKLGQGQALPAILESMSEVAEGVKTTRAVHLLAQRLGVEMPIVDAVYRILYEDLAPREAIKKLMARELKDELEAMTETW
ncbi:MAG: NAD(P)-dependent glycerol-3-phosphate dehydrogenase [Syntrophales bacterium]|nr:NAD(P)-dependent glycerol-3-phosphate dehydrogenase [Syntrophales bacterium]MDD5643115.1 NAD(P)-dependent glycerol-3-phosphate dehydrogenase [Syntrophales bacterium]